MKYKIVYQGQIGDPSGYGVAGRGYIKCLLEYFKKSKISVDFKIAPIVADKMNTLTAEESQMIKKHSFKSDEEMKEFIKDKDYFYIFHHPPVFARKIELTYMLARNSLKNICFTVWETDALPPVWNDIFLQFKVEKIVVPCEWNKNLFEESLAKFDNIIPVAAVPHLVNDEFVKDTMDQEVSSNVQSYCNPEQFTCLTVGQWTERKSLINVVKAFCMEFFNNEDCNLVVKTYGNIQDDNPEYQQQQQQSIAQQIMTYKRAISSDNIGDPSKCQVTLLYGLLSKCDMNFLYEKADVFALFSKAEGFGLPMAEALLHRTPVMVHDRGGHVDFVDSENNFTVQTYETPSYCTSIPGVYSCESNWYDTDLLSARKKMREAYEMWKNDSDALQKRGEKARAYMLQKTGDSYELGKKLFNFIVG